MLNDFYDESESLVKFEAFYGPKKHLIDKCIIIFSNVIIEDLLARHECRKLSEITGCNGSIPIWGFDWAGETIGFYLTPIGSALCGGNIAEVNHLTGATKFVMFGSCGSLNAEATNGRFIVPTEAYRGEGLSFYYAPASDYITIKNADKVAAILSELGVPFVKGRDWTTDSMLRETVNLVNKRRAEGCLTVEMELAGAEAVCDFFGFELYDFLAAGDVFADDGYSIENLASANHNVDKLEIAMQIVSRI